MIRRLAAVLAATVAVVATTSAPARADGELGLSTDGVSWASELTTPLFAPTSRIVPGDVEVRSFQARNQGPSVGILTVDVLSSDPDGLLASSDLDLEAKVGNGPWQPVAVGTTRAATRLKVPRGRQVEVDLRASFDWASTRRVQSVPFSVRLTLSESGSVAGEEAGKGDKGSKGEVGGAEDGLPDTGSSISPGLVALGAALVGAGLALVRRRGRREDGDCHA